MNTKWTAERLDRLPDDTLIGYTFKGHKVRLWITAGMWPGGEAVIGVADPGSIHEISVPIDALLNPKPASVGLGRIDPTSKGALMVVSAAIEHATGGTL